MKLNEVVLNNLMGAVKMTHDEEIGCEACFDQINSFAEQKLMGLSPEKAMPLVEEHLKKCGECREEYQALLEAMKELKVYS